MVSRCFFMPLLAVVFAGLSAGASSLLAEESTAPLVQQLHALAKQKAFRVHIVGHIEGEGGNVPETADTEATIKRLIPKAYSFVLGFGPDHSISSLTVYGADQPGATPSKAPDGIPAEQPASELALSVERQVGLASDEVAKALARTLADRSAAEVRAKLAAIELLAEMPMEGARDSLEKGLGARQPEVRLATIKAIEKTGSDEAVFLMAQAYYVETNPGVLRHLRERFSSMNHPLAVALMRSSRP